MEVAANEFELALFAKVWGPVSNARDAAPLCERERFTFLRSKDCGRLILSLFVVVQAMYIDV